jgi:hypothetical protein
VGGHRSHGVVDGGVVGVEAHRLLQGGIGLGPQIQVDADHAEEEVGFSVLGLQGSGVGQIPKGTAQVPLLVGHTREVDEQPHRSRSQPPGGLQGLPGEGQIAPGLVEPPQVPEIVGGGPAPCPEGLEDTYGQVLPAVAHESGQRGAQIRLGDAGTGQKNLRRPIRLLAVTPPRVVSETHGERGGALPILRSEPVQVLEGALVLPEHLVKHRALEARLGVVRGIAQDRLVDGEDPLGSRRVVAAGLLVETAQVEVRVGELWVETHCLPKAALGLGRSALGGLEDSEEVVGGRAGGIEL